MNSRLFSTVFEQSSFRSGTKNIAKIPTSFTAKSEKSLHQLVYGDSLLILRYNKRQKPSKTMSF